VQAVVAGLLRQVDGVGGVLLRVRVGTPAVADDEKDRFARSAHDGKPTRMTAEAAGQKVNFAAFRADTGLEKSDAIPRLAALMLLEAPR
jgi:hypothetical protein